MTVNTDRQVLTLHYNMLNSNDNEQETELWL